MFQAWLLILSVFLSSMLFFGPVTALYYFKWLGVGYKFLFLSQISFTLALSLFEVPTGYFADKFGRKTSVMVGLLGVAAMLPLFLIRSIWAAIIAEFMIGLFATFISGANKALLYDILEENNIRNSRKWMARMNSAKTAGRMAGMVIGPLLIHLFGDPFYLPMTFVATAATHAFAAFLLIPLKNTKGAVGHPMIEGLKGMEFLLKKHRNILISWAVFMPSALFAFWFYQTLLPPLGFPVSALGLLSASFNAMSMIAAHFEVPVALASFLSGVLFMSMASDNIWLIIMAVFGISSLRMSKMTTLEDMVARAADKRKRATILSALSMASNLSRTAMYMIIGVLADLSEAHALLFLGIILLALAAFEMFAFRRG